MVGISITSSTMGSLGIAVWFCAGVLCFVGCYGIEVSIVKPAQSQLVENDQKDASLTVVCSAGTDTPGATFTWFKIDENDEKEIPFGNNPTEPLDGVLLITKPSKEHGGTYRCVGKDAKGNEDSSDISLDFVAPVKFTDDAVEQHPMEGKDGRITCNVTGDDDINVNWKRIKEDRKMESIKADGSAYSFERDGQTLVIKSFLKESHDGTYRCYAYQIIAGKVINRNVEVTGYSAPVFDEPAIAPAKAVGKEDSELQLTCSATGTPTPTIAWFKGSDEASGTKIDNQADKYVIADNSLTVQKLNGDDGSDYTCTASNVVSKIETKVKLTVLLKPKLLNMNAEEVLTEHKDVDIPCAYEGDGVTAVWKKDGADLTRAESVDAAGDDHVFYVNDAATSTAHLHVKDLALADAGKYQCIGTNEAGERTADVELKVQYAPKMIAFSPEEPVKKPLGVEMQFECSGEGVPIPMVTWFNPANKDPITDAGITIENGDPENNVVKSTLKVESVSELHIGKWKCEISNDEGTIEQVLELKKILIPPSLTDEPTVDTLLSTYVKVNLDLWESMTADADDAPDSIFVQYYVETTGQDEATVWDTAIEKSLSFVPAEKVKVTDLEPLTSYAMRFRAQNEAGNSEWSQTLKFNTTKPAVPEKPRFLSTETRLECKEGPCHIEWEEPEHMGKAVEKYYVRYIKLGKDDSGNFVERAEPPTDEEWTQVSFPKETTKLDATEELELEEAEWYMIEVRAENDVGLSLPTDPKMYIKTLHAPDVPEIQKGGVDTGGVVAIVIILILIIVLVIDAICYFMNQCGMIMCVCIHCCGKTPPEIAAKEVAVEEGKVREISMEKQALSDIPNGDKESGDTAGGQIYSSDASEQTPMIK